MKITHKKFFKYFYISIIVFWILISIHVFYRYVEYSSEEKPIKGGTFVEAGTENATFLPYISNNSQDKFFQSFLFNGCLEPYVTGTKIGYKEDLCNVNTNNDKTFSVTAKENKTWSNGEKVDINDIYFTYNKILKENIWNIDYLKKYQNIKVSKPSKNKVKVQFPLSSIDNKIFFTNFILPKEQLKNGTIENYINKFQREPITTDCGKLNNNVKDPNSIVFDLSKCEKNYLNSYQYKDFSSITGIRNYIENSENEIIDSYNYSKKQEGFKNNKVILNQFISMFFNTQKELIDNEFRKSFISIVENNFFSTGYKDYIIKDQFLFNKQISGKNLKQLLKQRQQELSEPKKVEKNLPKLKNNISLSTGSKNTGDSYYLENIQGDEFELNINLGQTAQRVSVSHNGGQEYFLSLFQAGSSNAIYNISPSFQNIQQGKNNYTIKGYKNDEVKFTKNIIIHYKEKPTKTIPASDEKIKIKVIYKENPTKNFVINNLKDILREKEIIKYFSFKKFKNRDKFEGRLQSKNYDMVLRGINMGLKKDISNIFKTLSPTINASLYENNELSSLVNQYFLNNNDTRKTIKNEIDRIYSNDAPIYIFGKKYGNINIRKDLNFSYPSRLYDYRMKKDHIQKIKLKKGLKINKKELLNTDNFIKFIKSNL